MSENRIKIAANSLGVGGNTAGAGDKVWMRRGRGKVKVEIVEVDDGAQTFTYKDELGEATGEACDVSSKVIS